MPGRSGIELLERRAQQAKHGLLNLIPEMEKKILRDVGRAGRTARSPTSPHTRAAARRGERQGAACSRAARAVVGRGAGRHAERVVDGRALGGRAGQGGSSTTGQLHDAVAQGLVDVMSDEILNGGEGGCS